jgi:hypothetical protein
MNKTINAKTAKIIRKFAESQTQGKSKEYTKRYYKQLKKEYKANYHE